MPSDTWYREKWELPADYLMVARAWAEALPLCQGNEPRATAQAQQI